ncbi:type I restriction-modification system subunit M [Vibrio coralliilyticus]|uniref:type I restriction-modification system subunit M n=1 Tax=Vibrio coralliilyticus TaxID=190893 RepID=UPI0006CDD73E|nr:class I SAM-dependent DNA methyltransferase [Vibrio coralliilyticus]AXN34591.1 SAM-dependent DNA methyltransferase [Vibrio coralliilyticus]KPH24955.1 N-6 DNA methylase [Vibrio coralliilyticus]
MITSGALKSQIDKLWEEFWTGGITNPLTVVEQITYLMYARMLDMNERNDEKRSARTGKPFNRRFPVSEDKDRDKQHIRWENFRHLGAERLYPLVKDDLFPYFKELTSDDTLFAEFMKDAQLMIQKPSLLVSAVEMVDNLPLEKKDVKGDLYEYLLSKLTTAGINGQFRTPRHIIRAMIEMLDVEETHRVCDPACGTGGFLSSTYEYLLEKYSSSEGTDKEQAFDAEGKPVLDVYGEPVFNYLYAGDKLENRHHIDTDMFHGFDFDATMLRVAAMNLVMHGVKQPDIHYQDTLSQSFIERFPDEAKNGFDIILANPPFKGSLDEEDVDPAILKVVKTKKTELLFVALIQRMLKVGGRTATIVPDGVLFGSSKAHQTLRKHLVEDNQLEAVISLPSGVFKPYAGVSTAILIFTKGGSTNNVWFYDVQADGKSLDDKRTPIKDNDLPDLVEQYKAYQAAVAEGQSTEQWSDKTQKSFLVAKDDIKSNKYDLSINRYKEVVYEQESYEEPKVILGKLKALENEILADLNELESML